MAQRTWTVMVYMAADNLPSETDLTPFADENIRQMRSVGSDADTLAVVVQIDDKTIGAPRRYFVEKDQLVEQDTEGGESTTGNPEILLKFMRWAAKSAPAQHYALVLWGHAYRFAFGYDGSNPNPAGAPLDFRTLAEVLEAFKESRWKQEVASTPHVAPHKLEILGFDACGMASVEVAYQLRESVDYLVASGISIPLHGWPYDSILRGVSKGTSAEALSAAIVHEYLAAYKAESVMMASLRLDESPQFLELMRDLSNALFDALKDKKSRGQIAASFKLANISDFEPLVDLGILCEGLSTIGDPRIQAAADQVVDILNDGFVVALDQRRNDRLTGVSAYGPYIVPDRVRRIIKKRYDVLDLPGDTVWPEVIDLLDLTT